MLRASPNSSLTRPATYRAGIASRTIAALIDGAAGAAAAYLLSTPLGLFFARRAVVTLRIGEPDTFWQGPIPMVLGAFGEFVYLLPFTLLVAWWLDPLSGATLGKRALGLRVRTTEGTPASGARLATRAVVQTVGVWGWTLALLLGRWELAAVATTAGIAVLAGTLGALGRDRMALHDHLTGTSVCRV